MSWLSELIENRRHNAAIDRKWRANGCPIVATSVGWRPDPIHQADGFRDNGDGTYSKLLRGGTEEYKESFYDNNEEAKG